MATPSNLSAAVTRILCLTGFPKELKTKDINVAFSEWENMNGGFKIKWIDDTSLYIVFQDAGIGESLHYIVYAAPTDLFAAKRAYLRTVAYPPATFSSIESDVTATIRPYDGPDAQTVIQAINSRQNNTGTRRSASISVPSARGMMPPRAGHATHASMSVGIPQPPSPSLPDLPTHPTLDALIDASLATQQRGPNHIGDPGKRMIGHALGVRHPGLPQTRSGGSLATSMSEMTIEE
jgi:hypothetical protein